MCNKSKSDIAKSKDSHPLKRDSQNNPITQKKEQSTSKTRSKPPSKAKFGTTISSDLFDDDDW